MFRRMLGSNPGEKNYLKETTELITVIQLRLPDEKRKENDIAPSTTPFITYTVERLTNFPLSKSFFKCLAGSGFAYFS
jgi:hypothetical protein